MNEIIAKSGRLEVSQAVRDVLEERRVMEQRIKVLDEQIRQAMLAAMEDNGIKSFENDQVKITYVAPTVRESVDTQKLKDDGMYEFYKKTSEVKASLRWKWKTDEEKQAMHEGLYDETETF